MSAKWDALVSALPEKQLREIDAFELKLLAEMLVLADVKSAICLADPTDHKSHRLFLNTVAAIHRMSASFGLNPGDRKRLDFEAEEEPDAFTEWMAGRMAKPA